MTWVKLDDQFAHHPKVLEAGPVAGFLHIGALCYASRYLTDGFIPFGALATLIDAPAPPVELAEKLIAVGLWENAEGGYQIHDFLEYNPSAEQVRAGREATRERVRGWRERNAVTYANRNGSSNEEGNELVQVPRTRSRTRSRTRTRSRPDPVAAAAAVSDPIFGKMLDLYRRHIGTVDALIEREVELWRNELPEGRELELWSYALEEAVRNDVRKFVYVAAILRALEERDWQPTNPGVDDPDERSRLWERYVRAKT